MGPTTGEGTADIGVGANDTNYVAPLLLQKDGHHERGVFNHVDV